jgi:two-component system OmpR family sensor kinase
VRLRRRLTIAMAFLLIAGLAVADIVTYNALHSFLYGRLDAQLDVAQDQAFHYITFEDKRGRNPSLLGLSDRVSPDIYVMVVSPSGQVMLRRPSGASRSPDPQPILPRALRANASPRPGHFGRTHGVYRPEPGSFDTTGVGNPGAAYRVSDVTVPGGVLITAVSLNPTTATLSSLLSIELLSSLGIVVVLCIVALYTVRRGLRPLEDMAQTAGEIAGGDLSQRVLAEDPTSEVGRLGAALNYMLGEIEAAFAEKTTSEDRLRQFVADASHELRTPLTSIRGYSELLRKGAFTDEENRHRALTRVEEEAARMGGLVDDLLLLARLDQGRSLQMTPVNLVRVGFDAVDDARAVSPGREIILIEQAPVVVVGDRDRLGQVAHNLIRNALVHTPTDARVRVEVLRRANMGVLRVIDEGPGIAPEEIERVFDRFYRGDAARTGQSTGLGLSIVKAIATALGGSATVSSSPGQGATFTIAIPLLSGASSSNGHAARERGADIPVVL